MKIHTTTMFEAAHRQFNDPSKCGKLHGHNWKVEWDIISDDINGIGYVIDFKELKYISDEYDHCVMLYAGDPLVRVLQDAGQAVIVLGCNPTAENLALIFTNKLLVMAEKLKVNMKGVNIKVWENEKSYAESCL